MLYRPRSLRAALTALERGVPIEALILKDIERDALVAAHLLSPFERRLEAAKRLGTTCAPWLTGRTLELRLGHTGRGNKARPEFLVMSALRAASDETTSFGVWKAPGRRVQGRRRVAPYVPADDIWGLLLRDFLPRELGRILRIFEEERRRYKADPAYKSLSFQGPAGHSDEDGTQLLLEEVVGVNEDGEITWPALSGSGFRSYVQALRRPTVPWDSDLVSWEQANPPLDEWELESLRREIHAGWQEPLYVRLAEIEAWNAAEPHGWDGDSDAYDGDWSDGMTVTMPAEELRERLTRMECKLNEVLDGLPALCERLQEKWPENRELSEAVDRLLDDL